MLIYTSKLRFLACFCLFSAASATFFNNLSVTPKGADRRISPLF